MIKVIVYNDIDKLDDGFVNRCRVFLPFWRREQMLKYKFLKGKVQNGLAYIMLVRLLCDEYGEKTVLKNLPQFYYNEHGKPFLKNYPKCYFSISHCQTAVAVALSSQLVGVDIEDIVRYKENLAEYVANDDEKKVIDADENPEVPFIRLWTQKEAVFKYNGTGITDDLKNILNNIECHLCSKRLTDKFISIASAEPCGADVFDNMLIDISHLNFSKIQ